MPPRPDDERGFIVKAFIVLAEGLARGRCRRAREDAAKTSSNRTSRPYKYPRAVDVRRLAPAHRDRQSATLQAPPRGAGTKEGVMTQHRSLTPPGWPRGKGYSHGVVAEGRMVFVSGQVGWDENESFAGSDFTTQFRQDAIEHEGNPCRSRRGPGTHRAHDVVRRGQAGIPLGPQRSRCSLPRSDGQELPRHDGRRGQRLVEDGARLEIETTAVIPK